MWVYGEWESPKKEWIEEKNLQPCVGHHMELSLDHFKHSQPLFGNRHILQRKLFEERFNPIFAKTVTTIKSNKPIKLNPFISIISSFFSLLVKIFKDLENIANESIINGRVN